MSIVRITKEFHYEGAHALIDYDGKCRHIHGHSYRLFVTLKGSPSINSNSPKRGMLMDFTELKKMVEKSIISIFDHALVLPEGAPLSSEISTLYGNIVIVPFQPTCENLVLHFASLLKAELPSEVKLFSIKLHETASSYAEWFSSDND